MKGFINKLVSQHAATPTTVVYTDTEPDMKELMPSSRKVKNMPGHEVTTFAAAPAAVYTDIMEDDMKDSMLSLRGTENDAVDLTIQNFEHVNRGTRVSIQPDETHAFITRSLRALKEVDLARVLCGLLNNNIEGFLYFGITVNSIIEGITIGRSEKDSFRNGVDRIMHRCLIPEMRANSYEILFTPVLREEDTAADLRNHNLYMIELRIRPMLHMVYAVYQGRKCYVRHGTETVEYTVMHKKQDMMDSEDRQVEEYLRSMNISAKTNLAELAAFVKKCLTQDQSH